MGVKDVRRGNTQAEFNEDASNFLFGEILIISIISGIASSSWAIFGLTLLGLFFLLRFRKGAIFITILLSIFWIVMAFILGFYLEGIITGIIFSVIALLISWGAHSAALEWIDDINYEEE
ncbi:hypothetical protein [Virgibacillus halodenitrificans]|uniref:hypothetical protein n=1 Tax=Virgibacillus halodenitrificans TaxID=1482 RepID=UPI000EF50D6F|nr:hypothetical protein [Virgibacillus halodenitrificans]